MRFFPVWNAAALGQHPSQPCARMGIRGPGAIDASGTVAPVSLEAEAAEVVFESPWVAGSSSTPPIVTEEGSTPTPVNITAVSPVYLREQSWWQYTISSGTDARPSEWPWLWRMAAMAVDGQVVVQDKDCSVTSRQGLRTLRAGRSYA